MADLLMIEYQMDFEDLKLTAIKLGVVNENNYALP